MTTARRRSARRGLFFALGLLVVWLVAAVALYLATEEGTEAPATEEALRGTHLPIGLDRSPAFRFSLPEARGGRISATELRGRPYAVTFLFTRCPDVCPLIAQELRQALRGLGRRQGAPAVVAISIDPRGDTREAVSRWLVRNRMPDNFYYAVGSEPQLRAVWKAYFASPQIRGRPDTSTHTAAVWLVDEQGRLRTKYAAGAPLMPSDITSDFNYLLDETSEGGSEP